VRHDPWEALQLPAASDFTCAGAALAAPPAETLSGQIMRHNALASMKRLGCSGIESALQIRWKRKQSMTGKEVIIG